MEGTYIDRVCHLQYCDCTLMTTRILKIKLSTIHTKKKSRKSKSVENKLSSRITQAHRQQAVRGLLHKRWRTETGFACPGALVPQLLQLHSHYFYSSIRVPRSTQDTSRSVTLRTRVQDAYGGDQSAYTRLLPTKTPSK